MNTKKPQENLPESTPVYYSLVLTRSYNIYIAYFAIFIICLVQMKLYSRIILDSSLLYSQEKS